MIKICVPQKKVTIRPKDKVWFNSDLRREIRKRNRFHSIAKRTKKDSDINNFKKQRNHVNNLKKYTKEQFFSNVSILLDDFSNTNTKSYWSLIKKLVKGIGDSTLIGQLKNDKGDLVSDDFEKARLLNEHFSTVSTINDSNISLPVFEQRTNKKLENILITPNEILDILQILKLGKATGLDGISHHMLKNTRNTICYPLAILFNLSLEKSEFPSLWKIASVLPLFKNGEKTLVTNYRPISLLSSVGKVFERVMFKHVFNYFISNNLLYKYQSGFIPGHSTVHQLIEIYHTIVMSLEEHNIISLIFCDISKAFDRVWHIGLLIKLKAYGIDGPLHAWFESYLKNRKQSVFISNSRSPEIETNAGVPQGSVLGPLLFLIYVNDIADELFSLTRLFADDTSLSYSSRYPNTIEDVMNIDLETVSLWSKRWLVNFNPNKTKALIFSNHDLSSEDIQIKFQNQLLEFVSSHKHLGITFDSNGKFHTHIQNIIKSVSNKLSVLRKLKYILS